MLGRLKCKKRASCTIICYIHIKDLKYTTYLHFDMLITLSRSVKRNALIFQNNFKKEMNGNMKRRTLKVILCLSMFFSLFMAENVMAKRKSEKLSSEDRKFLTGLFNQSGFDAEYLDEVFKDKRIRYMPGLVKQNVINRENPFNYKQFLEPVAIGLAKRFAEKWRTRLKNAEKKYGVDKEIIVAVFLVESSLGRCKGTDPVISVFSSIVLENHGKRKDGILNTLKTEPEKEKYLKRIEKKATWAKGELLALLEMKKRLKIDIYSLKGSYAGAFGMSQFLPSSYLNWACSPDNVIRPDLDYEPDAIVSVANYLKGHGWEKGQTEEKSKKVLWAYNHSTVYVETILGVAEKLK